MMSQEQLIHFGSQSFGMHIASATRLQQLVNQSLETLETILMDESVSARDRASVALEILERAGRVVAEETPVENLPVSTHHHEDTSGQQVEDQRASAPQVAVSVDNSISLLALQNGFPNGVVVPAPQFLTPIQTTATKEANILPINFIQIDNFLSPEELEQALKIACENQTRFTDSLVHNKAQEQIRNYRQSSVLHHKYYNTFANFFQKKVVQTLPSALTALQHPKFEVSNIVIQLTVHNDGCYYTLHSDANTEATKTREMTYVYYFYHEPKAFSGGELRMYDTGINGKTLFKGNRFEDIQPRNNSIVFFPSRLLHEVMPISCPSKRFEDSRFTFNGWLRR